MLNRPIRGHNLRQRPKWPTSSPGSTTSSNVAPRPRQPPSRIRESRTSRTVINNSEAALSAVLKKGNKGNKGRGKGEQGSGLVPGGTKCPSLDPRCPNTGSEERSLLATIAAHVKQHHPHDQVCRWVGVGSCRTNPSNISLEALTTHLEGHAETIEAALAAKYSAAIGDIKGKRKADASSEAGPSSSKKRWPGSRLFVARGRG